MNDHKEAERRLRILIFREKYGDEATGEAFGIARRTLYRWQASLRKEGGKLNGLDKKSTAPKRKRTRNMPEGLETKILFFREQRYRLGKKKIAALCGLSESKAGRILSDLKKRGLFPDKRNCLFMPKQVDFMKERPR